MCRQIGLVVCCDDIARDVEIHTSRETAVELGIHWIYFGAWCDLEQRGHTLQLALEMLTARKNVLVHCGTDPGHAAAACGVLLLAGVKHLTGPDVARILRRHPGLTRGHNCGTFFQGVSTTDRGSERLPPANVHPANDVTVAKRLVLLQAKILRHFTLRLQRHIHEKQQTRTISQSLLAPPSNSSQALSLGASPRNSALSPAKDLHT